MPLSPKEDTGCSCTLTRRSASRSVSCSAGALSSKDAYGGDWRSDVHRRRVHDVTLGCQVRDAVARVRQVTLQVGKTGGIAGVSR
jgi:hypothetical protein